MNSQREVQAATLVLKDALRNGAISRQDLKALIEERLSESSGLLHFLRPILAALGGVVAFSGLCVLMAQHWHEFGAFLRVALSLGSGVIAYTAANILHGQKDLSRLAVPFYLLAMFFLPTGLGVTLYETDYNLGAHETQIFMAMLLSIIFFVPTILHGSNLMAISTIWAGTWLFFSATNFLVLGNINIHAWNFYEYRALFAGLCYALIGAALNSTEFKRSAAPLYFMGSGSLGLV